MKWSFYLIRLLNFFSKFIPHGTGTFDDSDPPWFNNNIKQIIQKKSNIYRSYILNDKNSQIFHKVKYFQKQLKNLIEHSQEKYYIRISEKLMDLMARLRTYSHY